MIGHFRDPTLSFLSGVKCVCTAALQWLAGVKGVSSISDRKEYLRVVTDSGAPCEIHYCDIPGIYIAVAVNVAVSETKFTCLVLTAV